MDHPIAIPAGVIQSQKKCEIYSKLTRKTPERR